MAAKKKVNKTQFVKSLPSDLSAKDVVKKAKESGIAISEAYVYTIRSSAARKAGTPRRVGRPAKNPSAVAAAPVSAGAPVVKRKPGRPAKNAALHTASAPSSHVSHANAAAGSSERRFVELVADIGLRRAELLLSQFRGQVHAIRVQ